MIRRRALLAAAALAGTAGAALWIAQGRREDAAARAGRIGAAQGLVIVGGDPDAFLAARGGPPPDVRVTRVGADAFADALEGLETALAAYPPAGLGRLCKAIVIAGGIVIDGAPAGGFAGRDFIVLSAPDSVAAAVRIATARLGAHHESSSILWARDDELRQRWAELLPADWRFAARPAEQLARARDAPPPAATGFLSA